MLILGRKPGQYVVIDDSIIVKVIRSENGSLRLAIEAPKDMNVIRGELYESKNTHELDETIPVKNAELNTL